MSLLIPVWQFRMRNWQETLLSVRLPPQPKNHPLRVPAMLARALRDRPLTAELPGQTAEAGPARAPVTLLEVVAETMLSPAVALAQDAARPSAMAPATQPEQAENQALVEARV